jgi:hypothetical protein
MKIMEEISVISHSLGINELCLIRQREYEASTVAIHDVNSSHLGLLKFLDGNEQTLGMNCDHPHDIPTW